MSRFMGILLALCIALATPRTHAAEQQATILVFGDSISAGYGIRVEQGWVNLMAQRIAQTGYGFKVVNASVSGETTAGGLGRLPHALDIQHPQILILELGGNDGLRSLPLNGTHDNLAQMIRLAQDRHITVLLIGMRLPPNYGERYTSGFQKLYADLATQFRVPLVPFLLEPVALKPELMQEDGIHPTGPAQPMLLDTVWPRLEPLLKPAAHH
ncbi:MAG TPA: arylesterase [Steroidobacteraceae bacterium]|jgi:acyl-CoA thioesterase-1|nr:arylesterase [Steroidobacteraceae bacterium]